MSQQHGKTTPRSCIKLRDIVLGIPHLDLHSALTPAISSLVSRYVQALRGRLPPLWYAAHNACGYNEPRIIQGRSHDAFMYSGLTQTLVI